MFICPIIGLWLLGCSPQAVAQAAYSAYGSFSAVTKR